MQRNLNTGKFSKTHGGSRTRTYNIWANMRDRCNNPESSRYAIYGGRGIKVCERWDKSYQAFLDDMGERPFGLTIERKDVNGNYEPSNCIWETKKNQANNRRDNVYISYNGQTKTLSQWADFLGVGYHAMVNRKRRGWSLERMLK